MARLFLLLFLVASTTQAQDVRMAYGTGGEIRYSLHYGVLSVYDHGVLIFHDVQSMVKTDSGIYFSRDYTTRTYERSAIAGGVRHVIVLRGAGLPEMRQVFYTYTGRNYFLAEVDVVGRALSSNYMAPLTGGFAQLPGDVRSLFVPFDNDTFISYDARPLSSPVTSAEVGAVYDNNSRRGYVVGSVDHGVWKTGVRFDTTGFTVWGGFTSLPVTRDPIAHGLVHGFVHGGLLRSPRVFVGCFADWRDGLSAYGAANRVADPPFVHPWTKATPVGWNSWGVIQDKLTYDKAIRVVDFFADSLKGFRLGGTAFIDLDSYWDRLDSAQLRRFVSYCLSRGLQPGIYWAPFTDWGHQAGPGRRAEGSNYTFGEMWTKVGDGYHDIDGARALDPTHPGTLRRIDHFTRLFRACGFKMIKIDFLGHAAAESSRFYDTTVTTGMEAYRRGMEYLVSRLGPDMLIYAAISPSLATGRYVHSRRIACDAFKTIGHTRYTLNSATYGWWLSSLYDYVDADHVVLDEVSLGENRARFISSIITGTCITGDDFSVHGPWSSRARSWYQDTAFLAVVRSGKAFVPLEGNVGTSPVFYRRIGGALYVAVFNFGDKPAALSVPASRLGLPLRQRFHVRNLFTGETQETLDVRLGGADATLLKVTLLRRS